MKGPRIVRKVSTDVEIHFSGVAARQEARLEKAEFDAELDVAHGEMSPEDLPEAVRKGVAVRAPIFNEIRGRMDRQDQVASDLGARAASDQDREMSSWHGPSPEDLLGRWFADDPDREALVRMGREILQEADPLSKDLSGGAADDIDEALARVGYEAAQTRPTPDEARALTEENDLNEGPRDEDLAIIEGALPGRPDLAKMAAELLEAARTTGEAYQPGSLGALDAKGVAAFVEQLDDSLTSLIHGGILHAMACEAPSRFVDGNNSAIVVVADGRGGRVKRCRLCGSTTPWARLPHDSLNSRLVTVPTKAAVTAAATAARQTRSRKLAKQARDLRAAGRSIVEIATALDRTPRMIERYLKRDISSS